MREALTVIGFLLIVAFVALFAAPLYVDWNSWRQTIASRLSDDLGTSVAIEGPIEARLLPQPWLSIRAVSIGDGRSRTRMTVNGVEGDMSLSALMRGKIELSNVVLDTPVLTLATGDSGSIEPLTHGGQRSEASVDNFEVKGGAVHFVDSRTAQAFSIDGIRLVGEARSLVGPFKAEGGLRWGGVPHTLKLATGTPTGEAVKIKASVVPANRPVTIELDGDLAVENGRPGFNGVAAIARPPINEKGDKAAPEEPWRIEAKVKATPEGLESDAVSVQLGPDERAVKLAGRAQATFVPQIHVAAALSATQLELDRLAGVRPDAHLAPVDVIGRIRETFPSEMGLVIPARVEIEAQGVMLGGQLLQNVKALAESTGSAWAVSSLQAELPGRSNLSFTGRLSHEADDSRIDGDVTLRSGGAATLISWLQGAERVTAPSAARRLDLAASIGAGKSGVTFSKLRLAVDDATVEGNLAWSRLSPGGEAGRIEADLTAERLDLDTLPAAMALVPGGSSAFAEADIKLKASEVVYAGIEAKSATGRVRAGGKLVALEDVVISDLGGSTLTANGRIDNVGEAPQGEIRVTVSGDDLSGLAKALSRSPLPPQIVAALAQRSADLSPANADIVVSFGDTRRVTLDGKLGGTVTQLSAELSGPADKLAGEIHLKADSLDSVVMLRQLGLEPAAATLPGRATLELAVDGPVNGPGRWSLSLDGAGIGLTGSGKVSGPIEAMTVEGRMAAHAADLLTPAQLFGLNLPAALPGETAEIDTGFTAKPGRLVLDDLTAAVFGMPLGGALTFTYGAPTRVEGRLAVQRLQAERVASLLVGSDLGGPAAKGSAWSGDAFAPGISTGFVGTITLSAVEAVLSPALPLATNLKAALVLDESGATLEGLTARLADGTLTGTIALSRSALDSALSGRVAFDNVVVTTPEVSGRLDASLDFQGTGATASAIVSSFTGGGTFALRQPRFGDLSEAAFTDIVAAVDGGLKPEIARVGPFFESKLSEAPLATGDVAGSLTLAGGVLRLATATTRGSVTGVTLFGSLDLATLTARAGVQLTPAAPADGLGGPPPAIEVHTTGPLSVLERDVDVSSLTAWLTVRSAEREAKKLEALEAERAAREKAMEEQRQAEAERMRLAAEERRKAEEAKRAEQLRKAEEARRAAQDALKARQDQQPPPTPEPPIVPAPEPQRLEPPQTVPAPVPQTVEPPPLPPERQGVAPGADTTGRASGGGITVPAVPDFSAGEAPPQP